MPDQEMERLLATAVAEVLETMFFSDVAGSCEPSVTGSSLEARVDFCGPKSGSVSVRLSQASARNLAASFLGESEESLGDAQIEQVVCELANMLCGSVITKMALHGTFDLGAPELLNGPDPQTPEHSRLTQSFAIERGTLTLSLISSQSA